MNSKNIYIDFTKLFKNIMLFLMMFGNSYSYGQISVNNQCPTQTVDLTTHVSSPPVGTVVTWHTGSTPTSANKIANPSNVGAGTYFAAYFDATNNCFSPASAGVTVTTTPCVGITVTNSCPLAYVDLTAHTSSPLQNTEGATLKWFTSSTPSLATMVMDPSKVTVSGTYFAAYYDSVNNCFSPSSAPVTVNIIPCADIIVTNLCPSNSVDLTTHISTQTNSNGAPVKWFTSSTPSIATMVSNPSAITTSGTYYAAYYDAANSCFSPTSAAVKVSIATCCPNISNLTANNTNPTTCGGLQGSIKICGLIAGSTGNTINYLKNGTSVTLSNQTADANGCITIPNLSAGTYTNIQVISTSCTGSNIIAGPITLSDPNAPAAPGTITSSLNTVICALSTTNLGTTGQAGATFNWSITSGNSSTAGLGNSTNNNITMTPSTAGTYAVSVTQTVNGCVSPATNAQISVNPAPPTLTTTSVSGTSPTTCVGNTGSITISGLAANTTYSLSYSKDGLPQTAVSGTSTAAGMATILNLGTGSYTNFTVTYSNTSCASATPFAGPVVLSAPNAPNAPATIGVSSNPVCVNNQVNLTTSGVSGSTLNWSITSNNASTSGLGSSTTTSNSLTPSAAGIYTVSVSQTLNGCVSPATTAQIQANNCTAIQVANVCPSTTVDLNSHASSLTNAQGMPLKWFTSSTPSVATMVSNEVVSASGIYYAAYYDNTNNCFSPASAPVQVTITSCAVLNPDFIVVQPNKPITGDVSTNDLNVPTGTTYGTPLPVSGNPSNCLPIMASNGSYTFTCSTPGDYNFNVPVCPLGVSVNCPMVPLKLTVSDPSTPIINSPIVNPDIVSTLTGNPVTVKTLANDASGNPATPLDPSTVSVETSPKHGPASVDPLTGNITYTPTPGFVGSDTLTYRVCDKATPAKCGTAQQIFTVLPTTAPNTTVAVDDYNVTAMNTPVSGNVKTNDSDPQGNPQTVTAGTFPVTGAGSLVLNSDGSYTFTPTAGFVGSVNIPYTICDNGIPQACAKATLYINVTVPCTKPILSVQNIVCSGVGSGYTVTFSSTGTVSTDNGTISGNTVAVVSGNVTLTSKSSCGELTSIVVTAPSCPVPTACTQVASLSVGNALCTGSGTYTVSFSALNGTVSSNAGTISGNTVTGIQLGTNVVLTLTPTSTACNGQNVTVVSPASCVTPSCNDGSVGISYSTVCNSNGTYNISYTTSMSGTIVTSSANSFTNLTGAVTLTVTKAGCTTSQSISVTPPSCVSCQTPTLVSASPSVICAGTNSTLSASCAIGTLTWYSDPTLTIAVGSSVSPMATTTYYGVCVNGTCKSPAASVVVNVTPAIALTNSNFTKTNPTTCNGTEGTIKICGLVANTNYSVSYNKNGALQTPATIMSDGTGCVTMTTLMAGTYDNFSVSNSATTCSSGVLSSVSLVLSNPPSATITLGTTQNPSVCALNDGFIQISGLTVGTQYTVNYMQNGVQQTTGLFTASSSIYTLSGLTAANYTNIIVSNNTCQSNPLSKSLSDPITATISVGAKTEPTTCSGNDGTFTVSGLAPNTSYTLNYSKDGFVQTPISFTSIGTSYQVAGLLSGSYTNIRVTNNGCTSNILSVTLSDPTATVISAGLPNNPSSCKGTNGSISITGLVPGTTYTIKYKKDGIWQASISYNAIGSSYTITGLTAGEYTNITVSNGGCVSNSLSQILVDPEPAVIGFGTITQPTFCGANNGSIIITGLTSGLTYILNYVKDGVQQAGITFTASGTSYILSGLVAANYTGINVNQAGCISNTLNTSLSNPGGAIIDVVGIDPISCSPGNDGKFLVTGLAQGLNYTLNYSKNGIPQTPISFAASSTSYIVDGLTAAAYNNITVTQASCVSNVVNVILLSPNLLVKPTLSISVLNTNCSIGTADLTQVNANNLPVGAILEWHTATPATVANKVADPTVAGGGTFYAVFYNGTTKCYGATTAVTVLKVPCANPDNANVTTGTPKIIQVLANDKNPDGTPAVLTEVTTPLVTTSPNKGVVNVNPDGTITYTPNANASGTDTFIYQICDKANPTVCDTALVTVNINCIKPVLTIENITCTGTGTYSVTFSSDGAVATDQGKIVGTTVTNIPVGVNVRLTSTSNCGGTSVLDVNSPTCPVSSTCSNPVSLSVGQPVCTGNGTYLVAYSISNGTLSTSSGTINQTSNNGTTSSGTVSVSSLVNVIITGNPLSGSTCTSQVVTVIAPLNCQTPSCEDGDKGLSYTTVCNGNGSYNINFATVSGATVSSSTGSFVNLTGAVSLTITENGCLPRVIPITPPSCVVNTDAKLQVKVFLQGAFFSPSTGTEAFMRDDLRSLGVIPMTEPYTAMNNNRFNKVSDTGGQTIGTGVLNVTGVNAIVDWVFVELRDANNPATVLKTRAALVQRDGDVVEANDGTTPVTFIGAAGTNYYVSVKHRNHLGAMTATPIMMTTTGTLVDFTSMTAAQLWDKGVVLGDNSLGSYNGSEEVLLDNGKMGLWAGNAINTDVKTKYSGVNPDPTMILNQVLSHQGNSSKNYNYDFATPVYQLGDINMDGKVKYQGKNTDTAFILFNIINKFPNNLINKTYNFDFMVEQIP